jgi:predicted ABC-class ATPase
LSDFLEGVAGLVELVDQFDSLDGLIVKEAMAAGGSLDFGDEAEHEIVLDGVPREIRETRDIGDA